MPQPTNIFEAIEAGSRNGVQKFIGHINDRNNLGETPLHAAVAGYHYRIAHDLLEAGSPVNTQDNLGLTPMHVVFEQLRTSGCKRWSMQSGQIRELLAHGASLIIADHDGNTPLHYIVTEYEWLYKHTALWGILRGYGALNLANKADKMPSDIAREAPLAHHNHDWMRRVVAKKCLSLN